jgi:hypothetical protein
MNKKQIDTSDQRFWMRPIRNRDDLKYAEQRWIGQNPLLYVAVGIAFLILKFFL